MNIANKNIAVLGLGRSGTAAARLAHAHGARVTVLDSGDPSRFLDEVQGLAALGINAIMGEAALCQSSHAFDFAIVSPGIDLSWQIAAQFSCPVIGELEFASRFHRGKKIAITGTNGKTTTTELIVSVLQAGGIATEPSGNHGKPLSEVILEGKTDDVATLEVSSFQLETVEQFHADIAVWLNFAPDHMDRYRSLEDYLAAKLRIFERQTDKSHVIHLFGERLPLSQQITHTFSAYNEQGDYFYSNGFICDRNGPIVQLADTTLRGLHNAENLMAAAAVADIMGVDRDQLRVAFSKFQPPPHRNELVATLAGREFINDSKATNLHALESSLRGQVAPTILIAGGKQKGLDFSSLKTLAASRASHAFLIGEIAGEIHDAWSDSLPCTICADLETAVRRAYAVSQPGETILFSPGTSSFDMFAGYAERGQAFRLAVQSISQTK